MDHGRPDGPRVLADPPVGGAEQLMARAVEVKRKALVIAGGVAIAAVLVPISFFATILLLPVWRAIEAYLGVEAIGHSGPAQWCFALVYLLLLAASLIACRRCVGSE